MRTGLGGFHARPTASRWGSNDYKNVLLKCSPSSLLRTQLSFQSQRWNWSLSADLEAVGKGNSASNTGDAPVRNRRTRSKGKARTSAKITETSIQTLKVENRGIAGFRIGQHHQFLSRAVRDIKGRSTTKSSKFPTSAVPPTAATVKQIMSEEDGYPNSLEGWHALLKNKTRVYGRDGIVHVWRTMRAQNVDVPCEGFDSKLLKSFWILFTKPAAVRECVYDYAVLQKETLGQSYPAFYEYFMGSVLQDDLHPTLADPQSVLSWHHRLSKHFSASPTAMKWLVPPAAMSPDRLEIYKQIYVDLKGQKGSVYDEMITTLIKRDLIREALDMHLFLVEHGDSPSDAFKASSHWEHLQRLGQGMLFAELAKPKSPSQIEKSSTEMTAVGNSKELAGHTQVQFANVPEKNTTTVPPENTATTLFEPPIQFSREFMYSFLGESHGIAPKQFSDEFCARLFATRAFSISLVTSCLSMFGVRSIGPLALRELALRAGNPHDITSSIENLSRAGVFISDSLFCKAVQKLAADHNSDLLQSLLNSDQHPDVLEDYKLQRTLLASYLAQNDWLSVYRTLTLLTLFHADPDQESWNILVRQYARERKAKKIEQVLEDMRMKGVQITSHTVRRLFSHLLVKRRIGHGPEHGHEFDDLRILTNICLQFMESEQLLPARYWHELLRRYGMTYRFEELARLCLRLVTYYSQNPVHFRRVLSRKLNTENGPIVAKGDIDPRAAMFLPRHHRSNPLARIFSPSTVDAIISWGFKVGFFELRAHPERIRHYFDLAGGKPKTDNLQWPTTIKPPPPTILLRGMDLIQQLMQRGVYIEHDYVSRVITRRLWMLYGPGQSARKANVMAKRLNPYPMEEMMQGIMAEWQGPPLFPALLKNVRAVEDGCTVEVEQPAVTTPRRDRPQVRGTFPLKERGLRRPSTALRKSRPLRQSTASRKPTAHPDLSIVGGWSMTERSMPATAPTRIGSTTFTRRPNENQQENADAQSNARKLPLLGLLSSYTMQNDSPTPVKGWVDPFEHVLSTTTHSAKSRKVSHKDAGGSVTSLPCRPPSSSSQQSPLDPNTANHLMAPYQNTPGPSALFDKSKDRNLTPLEIIQRRKQLAYAVFGYKPAIGGCKSRFGHSQLDKGTWERIVEDWARSSDIAFKIPQVPTRKRPLTKPEKQERVKLAMERKKKWREREAYRSVRKMENYREGGWEGERGRQSVWKGWRDGNRGV